MERYRFPFFAKIYFIAQHLDFCPLDWLIRFGIGYQKSDFQVLCAHPVNCLGTKTQTKKNDDQSQAANENQYEPRGARPWWMMEYRFGDFRTYKRDFRNCFSIIH